jgi:hypothetical protein
MNAIHKLIAHAVDYAGLFPPASLTMPQTVQNYARYRDEAAQGLLGRLVVPAGRLVELREAIDQLFPEQQATSEPWKISALVPVDAASDFRDFGQAIASIEQFNEQFSIARPVATLVDSIELKVNSVAELQALASLVPAPLETYFEIDCLSDPAPLLSALARLRQTAAAAGGAQKSTGSLNAKIRTGSVDADQIPAVEPVARFVAACARDFIPFKATAGLHHPIRNEYPLSYQVDAACGTMHGFVNMFVATLCAFEYQLNELEIAQILHERDGRNFHFEEDRIQWRHLTIGLDRIAALRQHSIQSFGSCSFDEPTEEIYELYQGQRS